MFRKTVNLSQTHVPTSRDHYYKKYRVRYSVIARVSM